jgi:predicted O-methyltransferase YrrM
VIEAMMKRALAAPAGAFVEVGVYHGGTAWHLARGAVAQGRPCYLYDTFSGIPYRAPLDDHNVGDFADTSLEQVQADIPSAQCVPGIFPASAREMGPIAFVHLDCDQERSYADALAYFDTRMVRGGVIWCDDVPCLRGAEAALRAYCERTGRVWQLAEKAWIGY